MSAALQDAYNQHKAGIEEVQTKIIELEDESDQHRKVLALLADVDKERNSMQMVGSVLVEKKVKDVIPSLEQTLAGLQRAVQALTEDRNQREAKMEKWKELNKIKVVSG